MFAKYKYIEETPGEKKGEEKGSKSSEDPIEGEGPN